MSEQKQSARIPLLIGCLAIPLAVGGLGAWIGSGGMEAYGRLRQPPLSPPSIVFPIVWTILYLLMGVSLYLSIRANPEPPVKKRAIVLFSVQLALNLLWTALYFALGLRVAALIELIALIAVSVWMLGVMLRLRALAGWLQAPYILWLLFACYLNFGVVLLN